MPFENLEKFRMDIYRCGPCGQCVRGPIDPHEPTPDRVCPIYEKYKFLTYSATGMNQIARALLEGKLEVTDELVKVVYECLLCENCFKHCNNVFELLEEMMKMAVGQGINTPEIVRAMRADIVRLNKGPTEPFKRTASLIEKSHNRFGRPADERTAWIPEGMEIPRKGKLVYFAGCTAAYRHPEIAQTFTKILSKSGVDFAILGEEEWCCGGPQLLDAGLVEPFEANAKHNIDAIRAAGAEEVVTTCADGYRTIKLDYPRIVKDLGFTTLHSSELLAQLVEEKRIKFEKEIKETVTYHDPCQLARVAKVYEPPRTVINSIPGIKLVEMEGNREYTECCGRYPVELPELSMKTGIDRVGDAQAVGATTIVTACGFCKWNLSRAAKKLGAEVNVLEITELAAKAMGL